MTEPIAHRFQPTRGTDMKCRHHLDRLELELDLDPDQKPAWRSFVSVYLEARRMVETLDALSGQDCQDEPMSIAEALSGEAEMLAVRVLAARRIAEAADALLKALSLRQRWRANRLLKVLAVELGLLQNCRTSSRDGSAPDHSIRTGAGARYAVTRSPPKACGGPDLRN